MTEADDWKVAGLNRHGGSGEQGLVRSQILTGFESTVGSFADQVWGKEGRLPRFLPRASRRNCHE